MFASMDDAYMQGRATDVKDVSDRLLGILSDAGESSVVADEPVIVAADDLVPSETVQLDKSKVLAFAIMYGSANSHTAVLAMIRMAAENAHAEGKWIGICGELGADLELTEEFLSMGLDELSVSPAMVLPFRKKIRESK